MLKLTKAVRMNDDGFTLVELMIVVAIIGILSAVAIPNFTKYQNKAKQTEAKVWLGSALHGMKSFMAEYNVPTACLNSAGIGVDGQRRYIVGTVSVPAAPYNTTGVGAGTCATAAASGTHWYVNNVGTALGVATLPAIGTWSATQFQLGANGVLAGTDTWTIIETGVLANTVSGI